MSEPDDTRRLSDLDAELAELNSIREELIGKLLAAGPEHRLLTQQADWHLLGLNYHLGAIRRLYEQVAHDVGDIAAGDPAANIIICGSTALQQLIFEFYAFTSLARITLDQLMWFARPSFAIKGDLPRFSELLANWETDSPVFTDLATTHRSIVRYLMDLRDCIVHFRTFATSDNTVAVEDGYPEDKVPDLGPWSDRPVTIIPMVQ